MLLSDWSAKQLAQLLLSDWSAKQLAQLHQIVTLSKKCLCFCTF